MTDVVFIASKTLGMMARMETWFIVLLALALLALWRGRLLLAKYLIFIVFSVIFALTIFPLGSGLIAPLESQYPTRPAINHVDTIIVLGGDEDLPPYRRWSGLQVNAAGERFIEGLALSRRFAQAKLVYTGGTADLGANLGRNAPSKMMVKAWVDFGVDPDRIVVESASRNTAENATMTRTLLQPAQKEVHLLFTSAAHMPRAMRTFERAGWTGLVAWPVDYRSGPTVWKASWALDDHLQDVNTALREYVGLLAYQVMGH